MSIDVYVQKQIQEHKNQAILLGSANYPFPSVLRQRINPFDLNAAEYMIENRVFPGCEILNKIEKFGQTQANVFLNLSNDYKSILSPYSGTQANQIVYNAILQKGDAVLSFSERSGGHPSHLSFLKTYYNVIEYDFPFENGINYDALAAAILKYRPKLVIAGSTLYPNNIKYEIIADVCQIIGAKLLADISHTALYVSTGLHSAVNNYADFITYTTHKTTRGIRSAILSYRSEYSELIQKSLCSISQGAPKYTDILCNAKMFEELRDSDLNKYQQQILNCSKLFVNIANQYGISTIGNGSSHMILVDVGNKDIGSQQYQRLLESNNILVTAHIGQNTCYIRLGFLTLATLGVQQKDLIDIFEIIIDILLNKQKRLGLHKKKITNIISKYTYPFYEVNYGL